MSRLRIIRDGAYSWLDEGPGQARSGRISGSLLVPPSPPKPKPVRPVICVRCGASLEGRLSRAVFCSYECKNRAKAARQRARAKAA